MATDKRKKLIEDGWSLVVLPHGQKNPTESGWPKNPSAKPEDYREGDNTGVRCGEPSGWLIDRDYDTLEAILCGADLGIITPRTQGHDGKPDGASHEWFRSPGCVSKEYKDCDGSMMLEIRSTGEQTMIPPSTHPNGHPIKWLSEGEPLLIPADALTANTDVIAIATLFSRHWPKNGPTTPQHESAGALGGWLARLGYDAPMVERIVRTVATVGGDDNVTDRARFARETAEKHYKGGITTGGKRITECFANGAALVARVLEWLGKQGDDKIDELNERHFVALLGSKTVVGTEEPAGLMFQPFEEFIKRYYNVKVNNRTKLGQFWLEHPNCRKYNRVVFAPPPQEIAPGDYNSWHGFAVTPDPNPNPEHRCERYLAHVRDVICSGNKEHSEYLLDLLAETVQRPGKPSEIATVLRGPQGTGKSMFIRAFGALFGDRHYIQVDKTEHVVGKFNSHMSGKVVVFADEAMWAGDKSSVGALKRMITEPTQTIERKGLDVVSEANCIHLFMATNEDWAVPVGFMERRFFVLDVSRARMQDHDYFALLQAEIDNGGKPALLAYLLARDISGQSIRKMPRTDALRQQQEHSMTPDQKWFKNLLYNGGINGNNWPEFFSAHELFENYQLVVGKHLGTHRRALAMELTPKITAWLPKSAKRKQQDCEINGAQPGQPILLVTKSLRGWVMPSLTECRAHFDSLTGTVTPWPDADGEQEELWDDDENAA
jgi:Family of unknown function (DUF5906)/Bifunctional DNA primase/polymerase, N-terminal